jgi:predicted SAM-dependent methyltransferase
MTGGPTINLELAAGDRPTPGFVHHDARALNDIEIVCDISEIGDYILKESCQQIRATHFLEHISHLETVKTLKHWRDLLEPGGTLYIEVPNLTWQAHTILNPTVEWPQEKVIVLMYGDQDYEGNAHMTGFTENTLNQSLAASGYVDIHIQDVGMVLCSTAKNPENSS